MGHTFFSPRSTSCLDRQRGWLCQGSGFSCVCLQQPVYCDDSICVLCVLFDLAASRERAAGSLRFVLGGSCSHTQTLKPEACGGDAFTWGPSVCESKVWEVFPFYGPAKCGWHFTYSCITNVTQIQVRGQAS